MPTALDRNTCLCKICLWDTASGSKHVCRLSCSCNTLFCSHNHCNISKIRTAFHHCCLTSPKVYIFITAVKHHTDFYVCMIPHCYNIQWDRISNRMYFCVILTCIFSYFGIDYETFIIDALTTSKTEIFYE